MFKCISNTLEENFNFLNSFFKSLEIFKNLFVMVVERFGENMKVIVKILAFSTDNRLLKVPWYNLDKIICRTKLHGHLCVKVPLQMYIFILISEYSIQCTCRIIFQQRKKKNYGKKMRDNFALMWLALGIEATIKSSYNRSTSFHHTFSALRTLCIHMHNFIF